MTTNNPDGTFQQVWLEQESTMDGPASRKEMVEINVSCSAVIQPVYVNDNMIGIRCGMKIRQ